MEPAIPPIFFYKQDAPMERALFWQAFAKSIYSDRDSATQTKPSNLSDNTTQPGPPNLDKNVDQGLTISPRRGILFIAIVILLEIGSIGAS